MHWTKVRYSLIMSVHKSHIETYCDACCSQQLKQQVNESCVRSLAAVKYAKGKYCLATEEHEPDNHEDDVQVELKERVLFDIDTTSEFEYPVNSERNNAEDD